MTVRLGKGHPEAAATTQAANRQIESKLRHNFTGVEVLLAEDNPINQEVALGMLLEVGLKVDLAENGAKAVQMVSEGSYSLILMDMQMPEMDGVEAAQRIRANGYQLPIIAMTANAFNDDRERCLQAGMDDFLAKPVVPEMLFDALLRWIPARFVDLKPETPDDSHHAELFKRVDSDLQKKLCSIEGIDIEIGLHSVRGKWPTYIRLLRIFAETHGNDAKNIESAIDSGSLGLAQELAHTLKGGASTLGITLISRLAEQIELPIKQSRFDAENEAKLALAELDKALPTLLDKISQVLG